MKPDIQDITKELKLWDQEISERFGRVSLQVVNDWKECALCSGKKGIGYRVYYTVCYLRVLIKHTYSIYIIISLFQLMCKLRGWNATNFVQNVVHVEQKQQEVLNEYGALNIIL